MPQKQAFGRRIWVDRFNKPTVEQLRAGLPAEPATPLFDALRGKLRQVADITEDTQWFGDCWFWTITYRSPLTPSPQEPLALIIPAPEDLQAAMPFERELADKLSNTRMKRLAREGFDLAAEPFNTRWGVWSITYPSLVDDVMHLVKARVKFLTKGS